MLRVDDQHAATRSLEHVAIAQDGKARIERHVAVATKQDAENGRERLDASARKDSGELRRGAAWILFQQPAGDPECAPVELAVGERCSRHLECRPFRKEGRGAEKARGERWVFLCWAQAGARRDACSNARAVWWSSSSSGGMSRM